MTSGSMLWFILIFRLVLLRLFSCSTFGHECDSVMFNFPLFGIVCCCWNSSLMLSAVLKYPDQTNLLKQANTNIT